MRFLILLGLLSFSACQPECEDYVVMISQEIDAKNISCFCRDGRLICE